MKKKLIVGLVAMVLLSIPLLAACASEEETAPATDASIVSGGLMYDKWWKVAEGASEPTEDNTLWSLQSSNTRSGGDTWRCKECHGWDYQGIEGAYSSGSHKTGFTGVYDAGTTKKVAEILAIMKGGDNADHDFSTVMGDEALQDIANFLTEGLVDNMKYINYDTKKAIGADLTNGKKLYDATCVACHGNDGRLIDFHDGEGVRGVALDNPWETLHKIRFGQPGTAMPAGVTNGWSTQDAVDVLGYSQTLPEE